MDPNRDNARWDLAEVYAQQGKHEQAVAEYQRDVALSGFGPDVVAAFQAAYETGGWRGYWQQWLKFEAEKAGSKSVSAYSMARIFARLGETEQAFAWLEKSYAERSPYLIGLRVEPAFDSLHSEPRYAELVRRVGLP